MSPQVDRVPTRLGRVRQQFDQALRQLRAAGEPARARLALELLDDLRGRARTHVGVDQRLFEPLPGLVVELLEKRGLHLGGERLARFTQVLAQAPEPAASPLAFSLLLASVARRALRSAPVDDEKVAPLPGHLQQSKVTAACVCRRLRCGTPIRKLWQAVIADLLPRRFGLNEAVVLRPNAGVVVEAAQADRDLRALRPGPAEQARTADPAKRLGHAARRPEHFDLLGAREQPEALPRHAALR